jgi:hypothetical protein
VDLAKERDRVRDLGRDLPGDQRLLKTEEKKMTKKEFWIKNWPMFPLVGLVVIATAVAFAESYHGLRNWALAHGVREGWTADVWPLQVDTFILAGEMGLLLSAFYLWPKRVRVLCWSITLVGLSTSIPANAFQELGPDAEVTWHLTAAVPPIAAVAGLLVILSILKQYAAPEEAPAERVVVLRYGRMTWWPWGRDVAVEAVTEAVAIEAPKPEPVPIVKSAPKAPAVRGGVGVDHAKFSEALKIYRESLAAPGKTISERDLSAAVGLANRNLARFVKAYVAEGRTDAG